MRVMINGEAAELAEGLDLERLLRLYKLNKDMVVVELNRAVPAKSEYGATALRDGDTLEIVKFLGGG